MLAEELSVHSHHSITSGRHNMIGKVFYYQRIHGEQQKGQCKRKVTVGYLQCAENMFLFVKSLLNNLFLRGERAIDELFAAIVVACFPIL